MKMRTALICLVMYLELTVAQIKLRVYRGNLVHSRELKQIEVLQDHLLGFDANKRGEVTASACLIICHTYQSQCENSDTQYLVSHTAHVHETYVQCSMHASKESTYNCFGQFFMYLQLSLAKQIDRNVL